jgi:hypothetical protein
MIFDPEIITQLKVLAGFESRDEVVREATEYIYLSGEWKSNWDRHILLTNLMLEVYEK